MAQNKRKGCAEPSLKKRRKQVIIVEPPHKPFILSSKLQACIINVIKKNFVTNCKAPSLERILDYVNPIARRRRKNLINGDIIKISSTNPIKNTSAAPK